MSTTINDPANTATDPIDLLVPAPRPWWVRMVLGVAITAIVGAVAFLWGFGYIVPRPECCGSGSGQPIMSLSPDGAAVTITADFFNSSGQDLTIRSAAADLPGADVLDIALLDPENSVFPTSAVQPFPGVIAAQGSRRLLITFLPAHCEETTGEWGTVTVDLAVADSSLPSLSRRYELADPAFSGAENALTVLQPGSLDEVEIPQTPLAAACVLLGR